MTRGIVILAFHGDRKEPLKGLLVNAAFAVCRDYYDFSNRKSWYVVHRPTGRSAAKGFLTPAHAVAVARKLCRKPHTVKEWLFTEPTTAYTWDWAREICNDGKRKG